LQNEIDIPVFHDDQHGTSIVTLAALLNALEIVKKDIGTLKIVFMAWALWVAVSKIYMEAGVRTSSAVTPLGRSTRVAPRT